MRKLIRYLKPFAVTILAIAVLLLIQAFCDLSLPDYMSDIVDIGIQQGGVENAVPEAIRQSEFDRLLLLVDDADIQTVKDSYTLLDSEQMSQSEYEKYVKEYPALSDQPIYRLNITDKTKINELNSILGKSILALSQLEQSGNDFTMPAPAMEAIKQGMASELSQIPESIITQSAVYYIQEEYAALGMDTSKMQNEYILHLGVIMLLVALLAMACTVTVAYLAAKVAAGLGRNLREGVFKKVVGFSNAEFDRFSTASLITRSTNDIQQIQMMMVMFLRIAFYAPMMAAGGAFKVLTSDYSMGWILGVAIGAVLLLVISLFRVAIPKFTLIQKLIDKLNLVTREILTGIMVIRAFNTQKHEEKKFDTVNRDITKVNLFVNRLMAIMMPAMMLIMNGITLLIIWVGSHQVANGAIQVGDMMAFMQYAMQIIMSFLMISMVSIMLPRATVSIERISEVLDAGISVKDRDVPQSFSKDKAGVVEFHDVSFHYPGAQENVLNHISFTAHPGQTTAVIGGTGSGKTTLLNLILRFYDVTAGQILVDGVDVREVSQHALREKIGYAPQKAVLFSGTVQSNLNYGVLSASEEELQKAAEISQATEFIKAKPEGFEAGISQGGSNISGGQKQRLSIARAIVKKPEVYLFDDSFSALDFKTDVKLREALKNEVGDSTMIIVAQRISTILRADQIIVLDEGRIVGCGTHGELMKNCEVYQQIALSQLSREELSK